jgi:hypothetical protein
MRGSLAVGQAESMPINIVIDPGPLSAGGSMFDVAPRHKIRCLSDGRVARQFDERSYEILRLQQEATGPATWHSCVPPIIYGASDRDNSLRLWKPRAGSTLTKRRNVRHDCSAISS